MENTPWAVLRQIIGRRRDVRAEFTGDPLTDAEIEELLQAAHAAPSVGNSQPWDFIVVRDPKILGSFADHVAGCRQDYADSLDEERRATFNPIKIEGIRESGLGIVATYDPTRSGPNVLGRHTIDEAGVFSVVCAIQNLWLMATAHDIGVGWVSFYKEPFLKELLGLPSHVRPVGWLCVGKVTKFQETPDLVRFGWNSRVPLEDVIHHDRW
jgi:cob(II)yrinic acid a,c-diamide reductase